MQSTFMRKFSWKRQKSFPSRSGGRAKKRLVKSQSVSSMIFTILTEL